MRSLLSIITFLCLCGTKVSALHAFPEKFVAVKKDSSVTLSCDKATEMPVKWKYEDLDLEPEEHIKLINNTVTLLGIDTDLTGNFTCLSGGQQVDYTYVLLDMSQTITDFPVSCTTETFNCTSTISCTIREKGYQYFRHCDERNNCGLLSSSSKDKFYLSHTANPFAEEAKPIVVVGEGVSSHNLYFKTHYSFYIRDIIKPGCPRISVLKKGNGSVLNVNPPVSWSLPMSFYPLDHEVQFQNRSDGQISSIIYTQGNNTDSEGGSIPVSSGISKLRARCRDSLLRSQWSEWTEWQNVGRRGRKHGKKQKQRGKKRKSQTLNS